MTTNNESARYDAIIVGSGAGGAAAVYGLVTAGLKVLLLEKGPLLAKSPRTLDIDQVVREGAFKSHEKWCDGRGNELVPEEYFNVGGKTKWYGAALLRYSPTEFKAEASYPANGWPIEYSALAPYYGIAEQKLGARVFDCEPDLKIILNRLIKHSPQWRAEALPMGLSEKIMGNENEARHFDGFASAADLKGDAETAFLAPLRERSNFTMMTDAAVTELLGDSADATEITGVRLQDGREFRARSVLLAAGALHSPRLLQRYLETHQLHRDLPIYSLVGRNLKLHLLTAMVAVSLSKKTDLLRKTRLLLDNDLPHSSVQPLGFDGELISTLIPKFVPRLLAKTIGARAYGFFLQTEDDAHRDNRVYDDTAGTGAIKGPPVFDYDATRTPSSLREHHRLVQSFRSALNRIGMIAFSQRIGLTGTAHADGTLTMGTDAQNSVVNAQGQVHGMRSLYVVDGSVLPRSSRVNPSLSIYAWGLRTADLLAATLSDTQS